jgi:hypothetical protein
MNEMTQMEGTAPAGTPAPAPAPQMAQGGVAPTAVQNAPYTAPHMATNVSNMAEGGETGGSASEDKNEWGQWIAIGLISLTLVSLIMQIAVHRKSMTKMDSDDETVRKDIKELKMNLKRQMGEKYETLG